MTTPSPTTLSTDQMRDMMVHVAERIIASVDILTEADRNIGDGDHGLGMARGFEGAREVLVGVQFASVRVLLKAIGDTLIDRMGGASGIIFGLMFRGGAGGAEASPDMGVAELASYLGRSVEEIGTRGGAKPGDKTMLDALIPAVAALGTAGRDGGAIGAALDAAAKAAAQGCDDTKKFVARFGKAATMGERSLGYPDAGATSVAIIFAAMADWSARNLTTTH